MLPATYPHVLAFPLHLALMTDPAFPFAGDRARCTSRNTIEQRRPIELDEHARPDGARRATCGRTPRAQVDPGDRGRVDGDVVWRERDRARCIARPTATSRATSTTRSATVPERGADRARPAGGCRRTSAAGTPRCPATATRSTCTTSPRKPFGFRHHIAHGMWTKARCLAELHNRLPECVRRRGGVPEADRRSRARCRFGAAERGDDLDFGVSSRGSGSPHLLGRVATLTARRTRRLSGSGRTGSSSV